MFIVFISIVLTRNFLSYVVNFGNFLGGNFLGGDFLGRIRFYRIKGDLIQEAEPQYAFHFSLIDVRFVRVIDLKLKQNVAFALL